MVVICFSKCTQVILLQKRLYNNVVRVRYLNLALCYSFLFLLSNIHKHVIYSNVIYLALYYVYIIVYLQFQTVTSESVDSDERGRDKHDWSPSTTQCHQVRL